jgi:hypothetical protein
MGRHFRTIVTPRGDSNLDARQEDLIGFDDGHFMLRQVAFQRDRQKLRLTLSHFQTMLEARARDMQKA